VTDQQRPSAPLQLDVDLRLHPQLQELGRAALLTDALLLPFTDIEKRLAALAFGGSDEEVAQLCRSMKSYLGRLNANPHIPLKFRLEVLNRFEQELDLFDGEMTASVLNAHKIAILMVQEKAKTASSFYPVLVEMIANAIELSVKLLLLSLNSYRAQTIMATRQFFDLARLGLDVATVTDGHRCDGIQRLHQAICKHELLRRIDFFALPPSLQQRVWQELQCHIKLLHPCYYRQETALPESLQQEALVSNLNRPNNAAQFCLTPQQSMAFDAIIIPVHTFHERLQKASHHARTILQQPHNQSKNLHTEHELENTLLGTTTILRALSTKQRSEDRLVRNDIHIALEHIATAGIAKAFEKEPTESNEPTDYAIIRFGESGKKKQAHPWHIVNMHNNGICLECVSPGVGALVSGSLVGLDWLVPDDVETAPFAGDAIPAWKKLGIIRWVKNSKPGEQSVGIEFLPGDYRLASGMMPGGNKQTEAERTWPVLIRQHQGKRTMLLPETGIFRQTSLVIALGDKQAVFKVNQVMHVGNNYTECQIILANTAEPS